VARKVDPLAQRGQVDPLRACDAGDFVRCGLGNDPFSGLGPRERGLEVQPALELVRIGKDRAQFCGAEQVAEEGGINDVG